MRKAEIADYDTAKYDYETYWQGRSYEDQADKIALDKLLSTEKQALQGDSVYIDIGGNYGRMIPDVAQYVKHIILFDYSIESLKKGKQHMDKLGLTNVSYVAGNIYFLPFKKNSLQSGHMIRVLHHIVHVENAFAEIDRVIQQFFILEFANKMHIKFVLKSLFTLHWNDLHDLTPMQQIFRSTSQGGSGEDQIFLNFHPSYIKRVIAQTGFHCIRKLSVSNLRIPFVKKVIPRNLLLFFEKIFQSPLSFFYFGPSEYMLLEKEATQPGPLFVLEDTFCCPKCKGNLIKSDQSFSCAVCELQFLIEDGIYDFRYREAV